MAEQTDATLFLGPPNDMETLQLRRDSWWGATLDEAIRYAVETMPKNRRYGAYIQCGEQKLHWDEIEEHYKARGAGSVV